MNPFEQEVREMLRTKVAEAPVRDEPPPVVLRRTKTLRAVNGVGIMAAAAAVVLGIVLGAQTFGDQKIVEPVAPPPVPWAEIQDDPGGPALSECSLSDLVATVSTGLTGGHVDVRLRDGAASCQLYPPVHITVIDDETLASTSGHEVFLDPDTRALYSFTYMNTQCRPELSRFRYALAKTEPKETAPVRPAALRFTDPTPPEAPCSGKPALHFVVGHAIPTGATGLDDLEYSMTAPSTARTDSTLRYQITLANPTSADITLDPCPGFRHELMQVGGLFGGGTYLLNCGEDGMTIPAGGRVTFEMEISLGMTPPGEYVLWWATDALNSHMRTTVQVF